MNPDHSRPPLTTAMPGADPALTGSLPVQLLPERGPIFLQAPSTGRPRWLRAWREEADDELLLALRNAQELQSKAEQALRDQTSLLAKVAHDLRSPLTPICIAVSLIEDANAQELSELRTIIERQVDHISRLVGDLLDLTRARNGNLWLQRSEVDLRRVIDQAVEACRPSIGARRQRLLIDMQDHPLIFDGDRVRLVQIVSNLLDNASKYTPAEGEITLALHGYPAQVVIRISDTGIGIRQDVLASIFGVFVQDANAKSFNDTGLGIGLSVVRELVKAHGGSVEAFSEGEGHGSQFVVSLPRKAVVPKRSDVAATAGS